MLTFGFVIGLYVLPIISAPPSPSSFDVKAIAMKANYQAQFVRELADSDSLHWGEGQVFISQNYVALQGQLAPGPAYKLYLSPRFVETEAEFERLKSQMQVVGDVKTFDNFMVKLDPSIELTQFTTLVVWCEAFGEFITSAKYR